MRYPFSRQRLETVSVAASEVTLARRIVRQHNRGHAAAYARFGRPAGYLIFDGHGNLVRWQRELDSLEPLPADAIILRRRERRVSTSEVLAFLQARNGTTPQRDNLDLHGRIRSRPAEEPIHREERS
jgi:hypothetical protein